MSEPDQEQQQEAEKQLEKVALQRAQQALRLASASLPHLSGLVRLARIKPSRRVPVAAVAASGWLVYGHRPILAGVLTALGLIAVVRHRTNIQRLLKGEEHRFGRKKQEN